MFSRLSSRLVTFILLKTKLHCCYVLSFFTNFGVVAAMLPIMAKKRRFKVWICENLGISAFTDKRVKGDDGSFIKEHLLFCNHTPDFKDFSILATNNNDFKVMLMERLLTSRDHPSLNKNKQSLPLVGITLKIWNRYLNNKLSFIWKSYLRQKKWGFVS